MKHTAAYEAYEKFSAEPLVKAAGGVDRTSFCAGFDTCAEKIADQLFEMGTGQVPAPEELQEVPFFVMQRIADWIKAQH